MVKQKTFVRRISKQKTQGYQRGEYKYLYALKYKINIRMQSFERGERIIS